MTTLNNNVKKKFSNANVKRILFITAVLALPLTIFAVFYIGVNLNSILLSFKKYVPATGEYVWGAGLANFKQFFDEMATQAFMSYAWKNTFIMFGVNLLINLPFHVFNAYYVSKKNIGSKIFRFLLFLPSILSSVITVTMFRYFIMYGLPELWKLFDWGNLPDLVYGIDTGFTTIMVYSFWVNFGGSIILFLGVMNRIPPSLLEAGALDGVTPIKEFVYIILPLIFPTISIFILNLIASFFAQQGALYTFYGSGARKEFYTFGYYYYIEVLGTAGEANYPMASAAGLLFTIVIVPIVLAFRKVMNTICPPVDY